MITDALPKVVRYGTALATIWIIATIAIWIGLGMYRSNYYSFGPSDNLVLAFVNIVIDTWGKYIALVLYILFNCFVKVVSGDWVYPYINAHVMNPEVALKAPRMASFISTNYIWLINSFYNIFFFALMYSQVDLALFTILGSFIGGLISSYYVIFDESRVSCSDMFQL
jgi:hypothetical protein